MSTDTPFSANGSPPTHAGACVLQYASDAFEVGSQLILGRRAAGEAFLKALCRYASPPTLSCLPGSAAEFARFAEQVARWSGHRKDASWVQERDLGQSPDPACLFRFDPGIAELAWRRRYNGARSYSLCGITHSLCSQSVMDSLGNLLIAPVQPWDALICTSHAAKKVIETVLAAWAEYLQLRIGGRPGTSVALPVIPLGVDCASLARPSNYDTLRKACRQRWKATASEVVFLFVGPLSFHAKANPHPLFVALGKAVQRTGKSVRVVLSGQFPNASVQRAFVESWRSVCPKIPMVIAPGGKSEKWRDIWRGADVFVSLADNIQETFGIAPLEAMAAGLPVVVSDWDGYRDTVRHGVDGFRIRSTIPPSGAGEDLVHRYFLGQDNYDRYIGYSSAFVAIDIVEATDAICRLINNRRIRVRMGEAASRRALEFDWRHIICRYEQLWAELTARRCRAAEIAPLQLGKSPHPLRLDPFCVFGGFATMRLSDEDNLIATDSLSLDAALKLDTLNLAQHLIAPQRVCQRILDDVRGEGPSVREILAGFSPEQENVVRRTIVWMHKLGLLRALPPACDDVNATSLSEFGEASVPLTDEPSSRTARSYTKWAWSRLRALNTKRRDTC